MSIIQEVIKYIYWIKYFFTEEYKSFSKLKILIKKKKKKIHFDDSEIVLVEAFNIVETILSIFSWRIALNETNMKFLCYPMSINKFYHPRLHIIYNLLGFDFINYRLEKSEKKKIYNDLNKINLIKLQRNFKDFKYKNIKIGDLVNDHYIRFNFKGEVDFNSDEFKKILFSAMCSVVFWLNFFKKNKVKILLTSHNNYLLGIPNRVALHCNCQNVININASHTFRYNKEITYLYEHMFRSKLILKKFQKVNKKNFKKIYKNFSKKLINKMKGYSGLEMPRYVDNPYLENKKTLNFTLDKKKFNILISCHDFFEGPNTYGNWCFSDFNQWIKFLVNFSNTKFASNFRWYIKQHPDTFNGNEKIIKKIIKKGKNFIFLKKDVSNRNLIKAGINFVLSVRGQVSYEFPYYNVPCLLASDFKIFSDYDFAFKSKNQKEYRENLINLPKLFLKFNKKKFIKKDIFNYYFVRYFLHQKCGEDDSYLPKFRENQKKIYFTNNPRFARFDNDIIEKYFSHLSKNKIKKLQKKSILKFINNKNLILFRMSDKFNIWAN